MVKVILVFIVLMAVGTVASIILATLRIAVQAMVIVAGVLALLAILGWVGYDKVRGRITRFEQDRLQKDNNPGDGD